MPENPYQPPSIPADESDPDQSSLLRRRSIAKEVSGEALAAVAIGFAIAAIEKLTHGELNRAIFFAVVSVSSANVAIWFFKGTAWKMPGVIGLVVLVISLFFF